MPAPGRMRIGAIIIAGLLISAAVTSSFAQGVKAGMGVAISARAGAAASASERMPVKAGYGSGVHATQLVVVTRGPTVIVARTDAGVILRSSAAARAVAEEPSDVLPVASSSVARDARPRPRHSTAELKWRKGGITPVPPPHEAPRVAVPVTRPEREAPERAHLPHADGPGIHPFIPGLTPHVLFSSPVFLAGPDRECLREKRVERKRAPWGLGWLYGYGRDVDIERSVSPFSHYLRTPLLSGLYDRRNGTCPRPDRDACAALTLRTADGHVTLEVALPLGEARTAKELRARLLDALAEGDSFTLVTIEGEEIEVQPGSVDEVEATTCKD